MTYQAMVLDGDQRSALAAVRSLGKAGRRVLVGESHVRSLAAASKYCAGTAAYASPHLHPEEFIASLSEIIRREKVDVLIPMTDVTTNILIANRDRISNARLVLPDPDVFHKLTNKASLAAFAKSLGVPVPQTITVNSAADLDLAIDLIKPPYVIKPTQSKIWFRNAWTATAVQYARTTDHLRAIIRDTPWLGEVPILIQQYIAGEGQGVFALYEHGKPRAWFAHRRIREKPPSGGISVVSESAPLNAIMQAYSERLLSAAGWHGVAMVEYKMTPDGQPYLIEVNGRFWGSLQLAVDSGVDFPNMVYQMAQGEALREIQPYKIGVRCRWLLGDLDHLYLVLKAPTSTFSITDKIAALCKFMNFFSLRTRFEINRLDDFKPFLHELATYFRR